MVEPKLFVAIWPVRCTVADVTPATLRALGRVVRLEYECLATYMEKIKRLPEFNDKPNAPKYSLKVRDKH
jgi:hypothetical protein